MDVTLPQGGVPRFHNQKRFSAGEGLPTARFLYDLAGRSRGEPFSRGGSYVVTCFNVRW